MKKPVVIHWFRQDLRLVDNPALSAAAETGKVLPVFIIDEDEPEQSALGSASQVWLHHSLQALQSSLDGKLFLYRGSPMAIIQDLVKRYQVRGVFWNHSYEPWKQNRDQHIKEVLQAMSIRVENFNGSLLWEPYNIVKKNGDPYRVFTAFYRRGCLSADQPREPLPKPLCLDLIKATGGMSLSECRLLPDRPWAEAVMKHWQAGELAAQSKCTNFVTLFLSQYKEGRDFPNRECVSKLSPHLSFGEISPNQLWHAVRQRNDAINADHLSSQLAWREFAYSLMCFNPDIATRNIKESFDKFPWLNDGRVLQLWQQGMTGFPMIDAGMRQLYQTGYMHNRVRMLVGSFLVKNLMVHWQYGERWFWDCLVDADYANNSASWQWVAGCGADAAPYFRIFNPVIQGLKFDPEGEYVRKFIPEIRKLPNNYIHAPWEAPRDVTVKANVVLGNHYPLPIVSLKASRERALAAYKAMCSMRS